MEGFRRGNHEKISSHFRSSGTEVVFIANQEKEVEIHHIDENDHRKPIDSDDIGDPDLVTNPGLAALSRK